MITEPLLLIVAFFIFFALTIVYVRLDFAITKDEGMETKMKISGICEKILGFQVWLHLPRKNTYFTSFWCFFFFFSEKTRDSVRPV